METQIIMQGVLILGLIFVICNIPYIAEKIDFLTKKKHFDS
ncbi:hypothetical protein NQX30_03960 [Candidatus Persebacteraceae bacterium Df01]|jgi:hypothetical protein|uniref:Uncharacterized protein n=1 Tax=Candidatus Doriopsillibacter californiensis TaxID=2970740 RepID=A0ABT7QLD5_9GAMM|nr:hypothetical protein [Candidatus Persebacteraceae bacterium Df01]